MLAQAVTGGLANGCIYGLAALSFVLIYKASETLSFMQGDLLMVGAFGAVWLSEAGHAPVGPAIALSLLAVMTLGWGLERTVLRHTIGQPHLMALLLTFGLGTIMRGSVSLVPAATHTMHALALPLDSFALEAGGIRLSGPHLLILITTGLTVLGLFLFFRRSRTGLALRAYAESSRHAALMGISSNRMNGLCWALGAGLAALAGILLAPVTFVHLNMGQIALKAFPAAVLGGMTSLPGALIGGLLLGVIESVSGLFLSGALQNSMPYLVLLVALLCFPAGLFPGYPARHGH